MKLEKFGVEGPLLLTPRVFGDDRGFFQESWNAKAFADTLAEAATGAATGAVAGFQQAPGFVQDNHSRSTRGVLRGLHMQVAPHPQAKLVRCVVGEIFDVAVDLRPGSASHGQWVGARLSADNHQQLWIPEGFAHGFLTLSAVADVLYKTNDYWSKKSERSLRWDDPDLAIAWPLEELGGMEPLLSEKDAVAPLLADA